MDHELDVTDPQVRSQTFSLGGLLDRLGRATGVEIDEHGAATRGVVWRSDLEGGARAEAVRDASERAGLTASVVRVPLARLLASIHHPGSPDRPLARP